MTTTAKVYRYTGNEEYAQILCLLDANGNEHPVGGIVFASAIAADGSPDTLLHVTPAQGLPVQQQTGATWSVSIESVPLTGIGVTQVTVPWRISGDQRHDLAASQYPVHIGGVASVAAPLDVSDDGDAVSAWFLRNGSQVVQLASAGALIPGDAANGLLVNLGANNDVNLIVGQAGISAGAGTVSANTPRVTLATNDRVAGSTAEFMTWPTGGSVPSRVMVLGGYDGLKIQPIAVNSVGAQAISLIDETSNSPIPSSLTNGLSTDVTRICGQTITFGSGTVSSATPRVTLATDVALPAGTNNIGDVDVLTLPTSIQGPGNPSVDSYTSAAISAAANTANQSVVAAPGASKQIWVYGYQGTADTGDGSIAFQDEDDTALTGVMPVAQNGGISVSPSGNFAMPLFKVATNKALEIDTVTCGFKGTIQYAIVDVS